MITFSATLTNCDIESIHIPGSTQSHGFVMVLSKSFGIIACSQNVLEYTGLDAANLIGKEIGELAALLQDKDLAQGLKSLIAYSAKQFETKSAGRFQAVINDQLFDISVSVDQEHYLLDFEPVISNITQDVQSMVGRSLSEILSDKSLTRLLNNAAQQVRSIIGYDRVMIYKFHNDGHGEVIAEAKKDDLETWMGLHYPASDIPKPARELYKINQIRLIADVYANTSPMISVDDEPLDLTNSQLRAVSPVHIQYLKNMGVASSFSISIMNHDQLWGLIACHSYTPRIINVNERESAKLVGQVLSSAIVFREQEEEQQQSAVYRQCIETITRYLLRNIAVEDALFNEECSMLEVVESSGAVLYFENNLREVGKTPDSKFINQLIDWLDTKISEDGCYMTNKLSDDFPQALPYSNEVCGLLACKLGKDLKEYMLWFRPEVIHTIKWAGNPEKQIQKDEEGLTHIEPRNSFEEWSEMVSLTSKSWEGYEAKRVLALRDEVNYAISRKATELRVINEKLRTAYAELDTFSYTISHDLKNPLSVIKSYAQLISREKESLSKVQMMAAQIHKSSLRMQQMIDEVLEYSKVGQQGLQLQAINMQKLLDELRHDLMISANNTNLVIAIGDTPEVQGDELMIFQVFSNLVGNAVKYSGKAENPRVVVSGNVTEDEIIYAVSDNGIGIEQEEHKKVFDLFTRAKNGKSFEGTGVGLSIVRRIVEKHQGNIWLESEPGKGSTFYISFKKLQVA